MTRIAIGILDVSDASLSSRTSRITEPLEQHSEHMSQHTGTSHQLSLLERSSDGGSDIATQRSYNFDVGNSLLTENVPKTLMKDGIITN